MREEPFSYFIFSSLYFAIVQKAKDNETPSGRLLVPLGPLPMFELMQRNNLFRHYFNTYGYDIVDCAGAKFTGRSHDVILSRFINNLSVYSAGHPRSIDVIILSIDRVLSKGGSRRLNEVLDLACSQLLNSLMPTYETIVASLVANSVSYFDTIPGTVITFDKAIAEGQLIGSDSSSDSYVPFLSPIAYSNWKNNFLMSSDPKLKRFAEKLHDLLNVQSFFSPRAFEAVAYNGEALMSMIRSSSTRTVQTFQDLLGDLGVYCATRRDLFDVGLITHIELEVSKFDDVQQIVTATDPGIFVPQKCNNAGFDFLVRYPTADRSHLNILYEMKYSDPLSLFPANLNKTMIKDKHDICKSLFGDNFIFVVFGWREVNSSVKAADLPPNTVVFDKGQLRKLYGPSFANFIDIQLVEEPQLKAGPSFNRINNF